MSVCKSLAQGAECGQGHTAAAAAAPILHPIRELSQHSEAFAIRAEGWKVSLGSGRSFAHSKCSQPGWELQAPSSRVADIRLQLAFSACVVKALDGFTASASAGGTAPWKLKDVLSPRGGSESRAGSPCTGLLGGQTKQGHPLETAQFPWACLSGMMGTNILGLSIL